MSIMSSLHDTHRLIPHSHASTASVWEAPPTHMRFTHASVSFSALARLSPQLCASLSFLCLFTRPHFCLRGPSGFSLSLWHCLFQSPRARTQKQQFPLSHRAV